MTSPSEQLSRFNEANVFGRWLARFETFVTAQAGEHPRRWATIVVVVAATISLISRFPVYTGNEMKLFGSFAVFPSTPYGHAVAWWLDHPFRPVPVEQFFPPESRADPAVAGSASHLDKLTFRAFVPLLNQVFRGDFWTLAVANHVAQLSIFLLLYLACRRSTGDPVAATLLAWTYAAAWAGQWGFNDLVCGDAIAVALLLSALAARPAWAVALCVMAAALTDERGWLAAPLVAVFRQWSLAPAPGGDEAGVTRRAFMPVIAGMTLYVIVRLAVTLAWGSRTGTSMLGGMEIVFFHLFVSLPAKVFGVFEGLWLLTAGFTLALLGETTWRRRGAVFVGAMAFAAAPMLLVWDAERSLLYLAPGILTAICFLPVTAATRRGWLVFTLLAGLVWMEWYGSLFRRFLL